MNRNGKAATLWVLAGIPVLALLADAFLVLTRTPPETVPVISGIKPILFAVPVIQEAAVIFRLRSTALVVLFVVFGLAWIVQGVATYKKERPWAAGAAAVVSLFAIVAGLVFLPLLGGEAPLYQSVIFLAMPLAVTAATVRSVQLFEFDVDEDRLNEAKETIEDEIEALEDAFDDRFPDEALERLGERDELKTKVEDVDDARQSKRSEYDDLKETIEEVRTAGRDAYQGDFSSRALSLLHEAKAQDAEAVADEADEELRDALRDYLTEEFGNIVHESRYGETYNLRNLPEKYVDLEIDPLGNRKAVVGGNHHDLDEVLVDAVDTGAPLGTIADAIETVDEDVERMRAYLDEREDEIGSILDEAQDTVDIARESLEQLDDPVEDRLEDMLLEGRYGSEPEGLHFGQVDEAADAAKDALHECRHRDAKAHAEEALETAETIARVVDFCTGSFRGTLQMEGTSVPIPPDLEDPVVEGLERAFEGAYDIECHLSDGRFEIEYEDDGAGPDDPEDPEPSEPRGDVTHDEVLHVLRELWKEARGSEDGTVALDPDSLDETFGRDEVLEEVADVVEGASDVEDVSLDPVEGPGFEVEVASGDPEDVLRDIQKGFIERA